MRKRIFWYMCILVGVSALLSALALAVIVSGRADIWRNLSIAACIGLAVFLLCGALAVLFSRRIVKPISSHLASNPEYTYEELAPMLERLDELRRSIKEGGSVLEEREHGLRMIMENMREGLILLDGRGLVLSMNKGAAELLGIPEGDFSGKHIFAANQNTLLQAAVYSALGGSSTAELIELKGSTVRLMANPVRADGAVRGVVLLLFDVTEEQMAEQMRREFSANVSHELKTPLTSITGYAEIMKDGLAKPEDMQRFSSKIYAEAQRLIALIDDIIRLSRLDEGSDTLATGVINLLELAESIAVRLENKAAKYNVSLRVEGEALFVQGSGQLLDEMIFNLCDNAIKYNRPGGSVVVTVDSQGRSFTVRDTGIGIPREHQPRVFERFYRVDKSHSKETGGTGLGLSIVKHGAKYHQAEVELDSSPDVGTVITLRFGKNE